jgi:hypothetical protein
MVPPFKKKNYASTSTIQEAPRQRKGESTAVVRGPKEKEHILRGGIDDVKNFNAM